VWENSTDEVRTENEALGGETGFVDCSPNGVVREQGGENLGITRGCGQEGKNGTRSGITWRFGFLRILSAQPKISARVDGNGRKERDERERTRATVRGKREKKEQTLIRPGRCFVYELKGQGGIARRGKTFGERTGGSYRNEFRLLLVSLKRRREWTGAGDAKQRRGKREEHGIVRFKKN